MTEPHENYDDIVEQKVFKYKYRQCNDDIDTYERRQGRVLSRFIDRARNRDPALEADLLEIYHRDSKDNSLAQFALDASKYNNTALKETRPFREYIA